MNINLNSAPPMNIIYIHQISYTNNIINVCKYFKIPRRISSEFFDQNHLDLRFILVAFCPIGMDPSYLL